MEAFLELASCPHQNVLGNTQSAQRAIGEVAPLLLPWGFVRNDNHNVVVAIRAGISPGHGTEEVDVRRPICFDETAHNLTQNRIAGRWNPRDVGILGRHS